MKAWPGVLSRVLGRSVLAQLDGPHQTFSAGSTPGHASEPDAKSEPSSPFDVKSKGARMSPNENEQLRTLADDASMIGSSEPMFQLLIGQILYPTLYPATTTVRLNFYNQLLNGAVNIKVQNIE
jgi:hypothetical protein